MMTLILATLSLIAAPPETSAAEAPTLEQLCAAEVENLHRFFHDWFVGAMPDTDESYARLANALDAGFTIVPPSGNPTDRATLLARLRPTHGSGKEVGVKIWIRNFKVRHLLGDVAVVTYEEWQERGDDTKGRLSTAVLQRQEDAPGGVVWLHLHETWLPTPSGLFTGT